jgi:phytoene dehydrogenase-like protein
VSRTFDVIVIGAGHNGLTAAALIAKRGRRVLVVERRSLLGGLAASEEFSPGFRSAGLLHDTSAVRRGIVDALDLTRHGLVMTPGRPDVLALAPGGESMPLYGDEANAVAALERHAPPDAARFRDYRTFLSRLRPVLRDFLDRRPFDLTEFESISPWEGLTRAWGVRRLGKRDMMELLRLPPMSVGDWLAEWFGTPLLQAALALPAVAGSFLGPRSPGSNFNLLLHEAASGPAVSKGGPMLVAALERAACHHGAEIQTENRVARILAGSSGVEGIVLDSGEEIRARSVAASCDPRQVFLDLLPAGMIPSTLEHQVAKLRSRGVTAHLLLAVRGPVRFQSAPDASWEFARYGGSPDDLERAFDPVKYRALPDQPALEVHVPTESNADLAPAGDSVISVLVHFVPYDLDGGWDDAARDRLANRVVEQLEEHLPGLSGRIAARRLESPVDLERRYGMTGGNIHHLDHALDQRMIRPAPGCCRYETPVRGLVLCGSGSHPGGGLTGAPGALAAATLLDHGAKRL